MAKLFEVFGPYEIDRDKASDSKWQRNGWASVDEEVGDALSEAIGIYIYSLHNRGSYKPIYVGVTTKQIFRKEVFNERNLRMLSDLSRKGSYERGTPYIHLLAKRKEKQSGFARPNPEWLKALEAQMIFICRRKNPGLRNKKHTIWLDGIGISGVTAADTIRGKPTKAISTLRNAMAW
jgi:hypothetical protein